MERISISSSIPHCIDSIDGKHIRLNISRDSGSLYNYKKWFSLLFLAICDVNYNFIYTDIATYGIGSDSAVFQETSFHNELVNQSPNLLNYWKITHILLHMCFVGDEAFAFTKKDNYGL